MQCKIKTEVWEDTIRNTKLNQLLETISSEFCQLIPDGPVTGHKPIKVIFDDIAGPTLYWPLNNNEYRMGLNCKPGDYAKASFQFAHLLCHIYIDPRVNNWFIESVSSLAGYYFLERFSYDDDFNHYIDVSEGESLSFEDFYSKKIRYNYSDIDLVQHQHSSNWIKREVKKLQNVKNKSNLTLNNMIAFELLPYFRDDKENWKLLQFIGKSTSPSPPDDASDLSSNNQAIPDFNKFNAIVPEKLKPVANEMVGRIWD